MTLPTDIILPLQTDLIAAGDPKALELYLRQLVEALTESYRITAENVNGSIQQWTPTVYGLTTAGTAISYPRQTGWYRRSGIITELWFDVSWTGHTGTGGIAILLPFKAAKSENSPWVGVIQSVSASNVFTAGYTYLVWNPQQDSTEGRIVQCGSGLATTAMPISASGGYAGYIQYLGQEFEN